MNDINDQKERGRGRGRVNDVNDQKERGRGRGRVNDVNDQKERGRGRGRVNVIPSWYIYLHWLSDSFVQAPKIFPSICVA